MTHQWQQPAFPGSGPYWSLQAIAHTNSYTDFEGFTDQQDVLDNATHVWQFWRANYAFEADPEHLPVLWDALLHMVFEYLDQSDEVIMPDQGGCMLDGIAWLLQNPQLMVSGAPVPS